MPSHPPPANPRFGKLTAMSNRWQWANDVWNETFQPLRERGFLLDRVDREEYWRIHEEELRAYFPPEVFINLGELRTDDAKAGLERIDTTRADNRLSDFCIVRDGDALVATFCGRQGDGGRYLQWHTHVHPDYRRRGIYKAILAGTIAYTAKLGFDSIHSEHAPSNNPVIIAKLRAGFRITALEVDPMVGTSVKLTYFHNPDHLAAYEFRCGLATLNPRLVAAGFGGMPLLREQLCATDDDEPDQ